MLRVPFEDDCGILRYASKAGWPPKQEMLFSVLDLLDLIKALRGAL